MTSLISAVKWIPQGQAAEYPARCRADADEDEDEGADEDERRIAGLADLRLDGGADRKETERQNTRQHRSRTDPEAAAERAAEDEWLDELDGPDEIHAAGGQDGLSQYRLDEYDNEDESGCGSLGIFNSIKSLAYHESNADDPYITVNGDGDGGGDGADSEDPEELRILPTDNLVLSARVEDDVPYLEVYVYEGLESNLYVHHDFMLPAFPLCIERFNQASQQGNFAAIGTMDPDIEVWNLDHMDSLSPAMILGKSEPVDIHDLVPKGGKKKKKKIKQAQANARYHVDSVLCLASNPISQHLLLSGSADTTIKLWDLTTGKCAKSIAPHQEKVSSLCWHPSEVSVFLSGGYDCKVKAGDMRVAGDPSRSWSVKDDVESVRWDIHRSELFFTSTEGGVLYQFDVRQTQRPIWQLQAHDLALSSFDINPHTPGLLATGSTDKTVKLWNSSNPTGPSMIVSRDLDVGKVYSLAFGPDRSVGHTLAVAGSNGQLKMWNTAKYVASAFRLPGSKNNVDAGHADAATEVITISQDISEDED